MKINKTNVLYAQVKLSEKKKRIKLPKRRSELYEFKKRRRKKNVTNGCGWLLPARILYSGEVKKIECYNRDSFEIGPK